MSWQRKLNPTNKLLGRVFLWFWLAAVVLLLTGVWLARLSDSNYSIRPIDGPMEQRLARIATRIETIARQRPQANLALMLARAGQRNKLALMLINQQSKEFIYGFPRGLGPIKAPFFELIEQQQAFSVRTSTGKYFGPLLVEIDDQAFYLFAGQPNPQGPLRRFSRTNPLLLGISVLLISGMFCALFAWSLVRPIRDIQRCARLVAKGDLNQQPLLAAQRGDELGELARDFTRMTEQLQRLLGSQKRLVADISHELRSPLARLQLAIGIAQNDPQPVPEHLQKQLLRIEKESQQIEQMIADLLKLSRLEANAPIEPLAQVSLAELLQEPLNDMLYELQSSDKKLIINAIPDIQISCFPQLLTSAVSNVVHNGVKYCSTKVAVSFDQDGSTLCIKVIDDGPGVPETDLAEMFKPFYRLSHSRARQTGGVGLGLAIVKQAIAVHHGEVVATNNPEQGLTVVICIPLHVSTNN